MSSAYTTTDTSSNEDPDPSQDIPNNRTAQPVQFTSGRLRTRFSRSLLGRGHTPHSDEESNVVIREDDSDADEVEATPRAPRARSRTRSTAIEQPRDHLDEEAEGDDEESLASPGPSSRLRSRDGRTESIASTNSDRYAPRLLPDRGAKRKALRALKGGDNDEEADMDVDEAITGDAEVEQGK